MAEAPLLACHRPEEEEYYYYAADEGDDPAGTRRPPGATTTMTIGSWSNSLPSFLEHSTIVLYVRRKYILAGFWLGLLMELAFAHHVLPMIVPNNTATTTITGTLARPFIQKSLDRAETWTDVAIHELSFLYTDILLLVYLIILTSFVLKKNLTLWLPITAANGIVGLLLGVSVALASVVEARLDLQKWVSQEVLLAIMILGVALFFVVYVMVVEMQKSKLPHHHNDDEYSIVPASRGQSSSITEKTEQETRGHVHYTPRV